MDDRAVKNRVKIQKQLEISVNTIIPYDMFAQVDSDSQIWIHILMTHFQIRVQISKYLPFEDIDE